MHANSPALVFPPEWAEQSAVLIAWPYPRGDFAPWLAEVEQSYAEIAAAVSRHQIMLIACRDAEHGQQIRARLAGREHRPEHIRFIEIAYDDVWVRDTAPLTVLRDGAPILLDFRFNGWGNKYPHANDARLAAAVHASGAFGSAPIESVDFVLEGGSLETDGLGTLLTTRRCLRNPNRNPGFDEAGIEAQLRAAFGFSRILWLDHGYAEGDDTDAHVDTLARFCTIDTIAYTACNDPADALFGDLQAMAGELAALRTAQGEPYRLVPLPIPQPILDEDGERLPATYANFLIINDAVLVPVYGDPADVLALERLAAVFPDRELIPIPSVPLIRQYGSIHCMSMQFPAALSIHV